MGPSIHREDAEDLCQRWWSDASVCANVGGAAACLAKAVVEDTEDGAMNLSDPAHADHSSAEPRN